MDALFNSPVFVKPLGLIIPPEAFVGSAALSVTLKRQFSLVTPTENTNELYVKSEVQAFFNVSVAMSTFHLDLKDGAAAFNEKAKKAIAAAEKAEVIEEEKPRRGRRRKVVEEETVVEEVAAEELEPALVAKTFSALMVKFDDPLVPLVESIPYKTTASRTEENEARLEAEIGRINKYVRYLNEARNKLRAPDPAIDAAVASFMPNLDNDIETIDRQGLDNYESGLKNQITEVEGRLRECYKFFEEKVIAKYNATAKTVTQPFVGEYTFKDTTTSFEEFMQAIREEVFIPVKF